MHLPVHLTCLYLAWCFFLSSPSNWLHTRQAIIGRKLCSIVGHVEANDGVLDCPPLLEKEKECTMVGCSISETREASNPKEERSRNSPLSVASVSGEKKTKGARSNLPDWQGLARSPLSHYTQDTIRTKQTILLSHLLGKVMVFKKYVSKTLKDT